MKILLFIILLAFTTSFSVGQSLEFGIKGGLNISSHHNEGSDFDVYESKLGIVIGGYGTFRFHEKHGIKMELLYSQEGLNYKDSDIYIRINRLSIPLLYNYKLSEKFYIEAGPEFKIKVGFDSNYPPSTGDDIETIYDTFDYGGTIGLEFRLFKTIGLSLRNCFSFKYQSEIGYIDQTGSNVSYIKSDRSNTLTFSINYYLN